MHHQFNSWPIINLVHVILYLYLCLTYRFTYHLFGFYYNNITFQFKIQFQEVINFIINLWYLYRNKQLIINFKVNLVNHLYWLLYNNHYIMFLNYQLFNFIIILYYQLFNLIIILNQYLFNLIVNFIIHLYYLLYNNHFIIFLNYLSLILKLFPPL